MLKKVLALASCLGAFLAIGLTTSKASPVKAEDEVYTYSQVGTDEYKITGVNSSHKNDGQYRIYGEINSRIIVEIGDSIFSECSVVYGVMISKDILTVSSNMLAGTQADVYYTGSEEEFNLLNYTTYPANVYYYAFDEGFINLWHDIVPGTSVCDVSESEYRTLYSHYATLGVNDRTVVDAYEFDPVGKFTIKDGMKQLSQMYNKGGDSGTTSFTQNTTLIIVIVISLIGMTAICVFYSFKQNEIIN